MRMIEISKNEKILIVAPHPDDESIGCGGLILSYPKQCDVLCITDGRQGQGDVTPSVLSETRKKEFLDAMEYAGVNSCYMLDIEDGTLCAHTDILKNYDLSLYDKIFVTGKEDKHPDHTASLVALKCACEKQKISDAVIYTYEVHNLLKEPSHYLDIDAVSWRKKHLIEFYMSQVKNVPFSERALQMNRKRGSGISYREVYSQIGLGNIDADISLETEISKMREYYWVYTRWMKSLQIGGGVAELLKGKGCCSVMIYGFKEIGKLLFEELSSYGIFVPMIIDKQVAEIDKETPVVRPKEIPNDMKNIPVIVTATWYIDDIRCELEELGINNILSMKELLESRI